VFVDNCRETQGDKMRIAVMGSGATGGYFGGLLAMAGEDVTFIARGSQLQALDTQGLTIKSKLMGERHLRVHATSDPGDLGIVDLILFCVKTYDTAHAIETVRPLVGPETIVLSVQNGIDNEERIAQVLGPGAVIGATALITAQLESPGVVVHTTGPGGIVLGEFAGETSERTRNLQQVFRRARIPTSLHEDIRVALWEKFLFICAFSGLTTLTRLPIGELLAHEETSTLLRGVMQEVEMVAQASGTNLPADSTDRWFSTYFKLEPAARGSMYFDLIAQRSLELEALNGTVVRLGREHNVATPLNFAIYAALKPYSKGAPK
jgi:2-dehydropantoate 2-reductase